jgi:hypothetical protein
MGRTNACLGGRVSSDSTGHVWYFEMVQKVCMIYMYVTPWTADDRSRKIVIMLCNVNVLQASDRRTGSIEALEEDCAGRAIPKE